MSIKQQKLHGSLNCCYILLSHIFIGAFVEHKDDGEACFKAKQKCELWFSVSSHLSLLDLTQKQEKKPTQIQGMELNEGFN